MDSLGKLQAMDEHCVFEIVDDSALANHARNDQASSCPYSISGENNKARRDIGRNDISLPVQHAMLPNGKRIPILKTMLTSACERNCYYCGCRSERNFRRHAFNPEELAKIFMNLYKAGVVKGVFLSSGVAGGGVHTQDRLLATAEILRKKMQFRDYIHLKIMPGAEKSQVERGMQLADRVSVNLEAPSTEKLAQLAPEKIFMEELLRPLEWVEEIRMNMPAYKGWKGHWPSSTTQFVMGGSGENDIELLTATAFLYKQLKLARAYYSAFTPVPDTPLESREPANLKRQHRLYQASFLLKYYPFVVEDLPFGTHGFLPLDMDPKMAWAAAHLQHAPIEINNANREELLRIPGIGPKHAETIMMQRRELQINSVEQLKKMGISVHRATPFILVKGKRPYVQLGLWQTDTQLSL